MSHKYPDITVMQFAKAPQLGRVKTRMAPVLNQRECLDLHRRLTVRVAENVHRAGLCPHELWVGSDPEHRFFVDLSSRLEIPVHRQAGEDLGERMLAAAAVVLERAQGVIVIGSDCPFIDTRYLEQAAVALHGGAAAVVGPADDGGYVLLGLRKAHPGVFADIPWGTDQVWPLTQQRLQSLSWRYQVLPPLPDIDRPDDLPLLAQVGVSRPKVGGNPS